MSKENEDFLDRLRQFARGYTDICPYCKQTVKELKQVGRCVYNSCGCRLWQGRLPVGWPNGKRIPYKPEEKLDSLTIQQFNNKKEGDQQMATRELIGSFDRICNTMVGVI